MLQRYIGELVIIFINRVLIVKIIHTQQGRGFFTQLKFCTDVYRMLPPVR